MDVEQYLERIDFKAPVRPTIDVLRDLHQQHMLTVPFENLDIHIGRPIILDNRLFYRKIVEEKRGGYCYELNGCFSWLLNRIGFKVSTLSARVARKHGGFSPEFDHMTLLVAAKERWLVDVGFGDSFTTPKMIDTEDSQFDHGHSYRISGNKIRVLSRRSNSNSSWQPQYAFSLRPRKLTEFKPRNRYQQTSPRSHFTQQRLISRMTINGRITLTDTKLIITQNREKVVRTIASRKEFGRLAAKHFQIRYMEKPTSHCQALPASFFPCPDDVVRDWVEARSFE